MTKTDNLKQVRDEVSNLTSSPLYTYRIENNYQPVLGEGNHDADILFIGEAPGKNEAETGRPFCGRAGALLDEALESIDIERSDVYITNIVKDRPPNNRDPLPEEIELYAPFLDRQIEIIKPEVIVTLGRFAMSYILNRYGVENNDSITQNHGKIFETKNFKIVPMYHPAATIYNRETRKALAEDFKLLKQFYNPQNKSEEV